MPSTPHPLSSIERYHILRDQIQHEDNLTTQRLSWLMASQAFLFTAYAIVLNGPERAMTAFAGKQQQWLITAIPGLALTSTGLIYVSIVAGVMALLNLHRHAVQICGAEPSGEGLPPIQGTNRTRLAGLASPLLVPPLFMGVWLFLMIRGLTR
ncbi:MAG: hypothetical protein QOE70_3576 [Chthoniobacter sp.]|jgi:hypothetical protein|nr:hypothetical protein [Chthoniobacter sp.]